MKKQKITTAKKQLTLEQRKEIMSYPVYWRHTLQKAAEQGDSIYETYKRLEKLEAFT
jgi:hypothetical protein